MPRRTGIQWTPAQAKRLNSAVRSFNAQLRRAVERTPEQLRHLLPDPVSYRQLRQEIATGHELNLRVNALNRARKMRERGVEPFGFRQTRGAGTITNYDYNEGSIAVRTYESRKAKQRIRLGIQRAAGAPVEKGHTGFTMAEHLQPSSLSLDDYTLRGLRTSQRRMFEAARETPSSRAQLYYENYMKALDSVGADYLAPEAYEEIRSILWEIRLKAPSYLPQLFDRNDEELRIDFVYDDDLDATQRFSDILDTLRDAYSDAVERGIIRE